MDAPSDRTFVARTFVARTFVERSGPHAADRLTDLRGRCRAAGLPADLLRSRDDRSLWLLVVGGEPDLTAHDLDGARTWRFETVDATSRDASR
ncbi:MAG: hypothetical protein WD336_01155 [Trueperaceae bacterium]